MMKHEFDKIMNEAYGFTYSDKQYECIEAVYNEVSASKKDMAEFCHAYDMNGIERLYRHIDYVKDYSDMGLSLFQIFHVLKDIEELGKVLSIMLRIIEELELKNEYRKQFWLVEERLNQIQKILTTS